MLGCCVVVEESLGLSCLPLLAPSEEIAELWELCESFDATTAFSTMFGEAVCSMFAGVDLLS